MGGMGMGWPGGMPGPTGIGMPGGMNPMGMPNGPPGMGLNMPGAPPGMGMNMPGAPPGMNIPLGQNPYAMPGMPGMPKLPPGMQDPRAMRPPQMNLMTGFPDDVSLPDMDAMNPHLNPYLTGLKPKDVQRMFSPERMDPMAFYRGRGRGGARGGRGFRRGGGGVGGGGRFGSNDLDMNVRRAGSGVQQKQKSGFEDGKSHVHVYFQTHSPSHTC
jgi:hypothetical protein